MDINKVYCIDCLDGLKNLQNESIDMIYLDPPFFTQTNQKLTDKNSNVYAFNDKWNSMDEYLEFLKERLIECRRVLKASGTIFLHCDKNASHYIKIILDEVFSKNNFINEIIWTYKRWTNSKKGLLNTHQNIFFYSKTKKYNFYTQYVDYSPTTNIDQILQDRVKINGKTTYKKDNNGDIILTHNKKGVPLNDVWEIPFLNPKAKERVSYPTQKPISLLEKIIDISTKENDIICDPFCGSGTTLVAAKLKNRNFIGFDLNKNAIKLANNRLNNPIYSISNVLKNGYKSYKNQTSDKRKILQMFNCRVVERNNTIDGIYINDVTKEIVGIKIQKEKEQINQCIEQLIYQIKNKKINSAILIKKSSEKYEIKNTNIHIIDYQMLKL